MYASVEAADIDISAAGEIFVPFSAIPGDIRLRMVVHAALVGADREGIPVLIEFDPLPATAVVILVPDETGGLPLAGKCFPESLVPVRIDQFRQQAETRIRKENIGFRQSPHIPERMHAFAVIETFLCGIMQGHVEIEIVPGSIVIIHVDAHGEPSHPSLILRPGHAFLLRLRIRQRRVAEAHRHLREPVPVIIIEQERILPVVAEVLHLRGEPVGLEENTVAAVVGIEIGNTVLFPAQQIEFAPVDIVEDSVPVIVQDEHVVPGLASTDGIIHDQLHVRHAIPGQVREFDDKVVFPVLVPVDQETVVDRIPFQVPFFHVAVIIQPEDGHTVGDIGLDGILTAVAVKIHELRVLPDRGTERKDLEILVPIRLSLGCEGRQEQDEGR